MPSRNSQGRVVLWSISHSRKVAALSDPWAKLLFSWILTSVDNLGRMEGAAELVRAMIFPREPSITNEQVDGWLNEIHHLELICRYEQKGDLFLQIKDSKIALSGNMKPVSDFPDPPENCPICSSSGRVRTRISRRDRDFDREGEVEVEGLRLPPGVDEAYREACVLFGADDDVGWFLELMRDHARVDFAYELKAFHDYWEKPPNKRKRKNVKNAIRNWMRRVKPEDAPPPRRRAAPMPPALDPIPRNAAADQCWQQALTSLEAEIDPHTFATWFRPTYGAALSGGVLEVATPSAIFRDWLRDHHGEQCSVAAGQAVEFVAPEDHRLRPEREVVS